MPLIGPSSYLQVLKIQYSRDAKNVTKEALMSKRSERNSDADGSHWPGTASAAVEVVRDVPSLQALSSAAPLLAQQQLIKGQDDAAINLLKHIFGAYVPPSWTCCH